MNSSKFHIAALIGWSASVIFLQGCASSMRFASRNEAPDNSAEQRGINDTTYEVSPTSSKSGRPLLVLQGVASYYAFEFRGQKTSSGEIFDLDSLTAAHRVLPFGTKVRVTNLINKKSVVVRINDRGPFKVERIIDLSLAAAKAIDLLQTGTAPVLLEVLAWGRGE